MAEVPLEPYFPSGYDDGFAEPVSGVSAKKLTTVP